MLFLYILNLLFFVLNPTQEDTLLKLWDEAVVTKANTAINADYLSSEEKKVILYTNLARLDGQHFAETFLNEYLRNTKSSSYTRSLYKDLQKISNLPPLMPQKDLYLAANGHAVKSGKRGILGHQGFDARFKPLMGDYNAVAENCAYGYDQAVDIVIGLLIDEGIKDLGHRENMLNPIYNSVGVSIEDHKTYKYNCVMDFGKKIK